MSQTSKSLLPLLLADNYKEQQSKYECKVKPPGLSTQHTAVFLKIILTYAIL